MTDEPTRVIITDTEIEALESHDSSNYQRQIRHRVRTRIKRLRDEIRQLENVDGELVSEARDACYPAPEPDDGAGGRQQEPGLFDGVTSRQSDSESGSDGE
jgi:hypothetical protein